MIFPSLSIHLSSSRLQHPLSHPHHPNQLSIQLHGLSLSLKSLFKFIVDSYLAMKLNTSRSEREIGKMVSETELRAASDIIWKSFHCKHE